MEQIAPRMTEEQADKWYKDLMEWIAKNHTHLNNREEQWKKYAEERK